MATVLREYDIGTEFLVTLKDASDAVINVSNATTIQFRFRKPAGTEVTRTGLLKTDGTDGKVYYVTAAGDLDEIGTWRYQVRIVLDSGEDWTSTATKFKVEDAIGKPE